MNYLINYLHAFVCRIGSSSSGISNACPQNAPGTTIQAITAPEAAHAKGDTFEGGVHVMHWLSGQLVANNDALLHKDNTRGFKLN